MKQILMILISILFFCCSNSTEQIKDSSQPTIKQDTLQRLTNEQELSFAALNTLQVSTDRQNHLYSTFANVEHPCYPPDTSFNITQAEFLSIINTFASKHLNNITIDKRNELIEAAVKAQETYQVNHCMDISENGDYANGIPFSGTWIMPNVLGRRDILLVW